MDGSSTKDPFPGAPTVAPSVLISPYFLDVQFRDGYDPEYFLEWILMLVRWGRTAFEGASGVGCN